MMDHNQYLANKSILVTQLVVKFSFQNNATVWKLNSTTSFNDRKYGNN